MSRTSSYLFCTTCARKLDGVIYWEGRLQPYCEPCFLRRDQEPVNAPTPPPSSLAGFPSQHHQHWQRLVRTAEWLQRAVVTRFDAQTALQEAQERVRDMQVEYERACAQMVEATGVWQRTVERDGAVPIGPAGVVDRGEVRL